MFISQSALGAAAGSYSTDYRRYPMRRRCLAPRSTFGKSFPKSNPSLRFAARFDRLCRRWRRRRGRAFSSRELAAAMINRVALRVGSLAMALKLVRLGCSRGAGGGSPSCRSSITLLDGLSETGRMERWGRRKGIDTYGVTFYP
uniref:Uncharacterized protein n=1 Tax=Oryza sativa subsp. japonica TaxID=39947 RepID=Q6ESK2_ORYSJ|nr:hypothetical protein [Oryza sativa Japonica Group]